MLLHTRGSALNLHISVVGRVTRDAHTADPDAIYVEDSGTLPARPSAAVKALLTTAQAAPATSLLPVVHSIASLDHLAEGDIVALTPSGRVNTLYRVQSFHNTLMATERCNSNCLMCSQPPKDRDDVDHLFSLNMQAVSLIPKDCIELGISGGEPTLMGEHFFTLLEHITEQLPNTEVHVLSNGRTFAWNEVAERLAAVNNSRVMIGIPLYSDHYQDHDYIVQAQHAFTQTVLGIQNLARYNQRIEIRVVLHRLSIPRLGKLARYIYKNMPYVEHVAFMGLEEIGYTPHNMDKLWIDPYDYAAQLEEATTFLAGHGLHVSIYNTQLCLLPETLWPYARKSISDWKNGYLPACDGCAKKSDCAGFFVWNLKNVSQHLMPFAAEAECSIPTEG